MARLLIPPPQSEQELLRRAQSLAGRTLGQIASERGARVPRDLRRDKGWVGQLIEDVLGGARSSKAEPDFPHLGIELKTIPMDPRAMPRQSTYVCVAPLDGSLAACWEQSWAREKLRCVLWMPIVWDGEQDLELRRVGAPLMWRPTEQDDARLRADWEELSALIRDGELAEIDARKGEVLQLRPKAANSRALVWAVDRDGEWIEANPRGFYLRRSFTAELFAREFA